MITPLYVVKALAEVREGGEVNMMDRRGVAALASSDRASAWIDKASGAEYMAALNEMGEYISTLDYDPDAEDEYDTEMDD